MYSYIDIFMNVIKLKKITVNISSNWLFSNILIKKRTKNVLSDFIPNPVKT